MNRYIDTSAYLKLLVTEAESATLRADLQQARRAGHRIVSSILLETELRRAAQRLGIALGDIEAELRKIDLISADDATFVRAGNLPGPSLRSLDAIHLAVALEVGATDIYTYDERQADAATKAGLTVVAPVGAAVVAVRAAIHDNYDWTTTPRASRSSISPGP